jgi:hypothetical protein
MFTSMDITQYVIDIKKNRIHLYPQTSIWNISDSTLNAVSIKSYLDLHSCCTFRIIIECIAI